MLAELLISILIILSILVLIIIGLYLKVMRLPPNSTKKCNKMDDKPRILLIGDSLTHGTLNSRYADMLIKEFPESNIINAAFNGFMIVDVLGRIDNMLRCKPDYILILIGSNDVNGTLPDARKNYERTKYFPNEEPDFWSIDRFERDYQMLIDILKSKTNAKIMMMSIPTISEEVEHVIYQRSIEYSRIIKSLAERNNLDYTPINELLQEYLKQNPSKPVIQFDNRKYMMYTAILKHYILGKSWDNISKGYGFSLMTDHLHLNDIAICIIHDQIHDYLKNKLK